MRAGFIVELYLVILSMQEFYSFSQEVNKEPIGLM